MTAHRQANGVPQIRNKTQDPSCVSAPLATNVDLFVCFAERLFIIILN